MAPTPKEVADERGPDSPTDLTKQSWMYVLRKTAREFSEDQCTDLAAALTYYAVLALFPAVIALVSLVGLVGQGPQTVTDAARRSCEQVGAGSVRRHARAAADAARASTPGAGFALVIGLRRRAVVGLRVRRRVRPGDEPDLRDRARAGRSGSCARCMLLVTLVARRCSPRLVALALVLTGPAAAGGRRRDRPRLDRRHGLEHRQVAGDAGRRGADRGAALLRHPQREAAEVPLDQRRRRRRHRGLDRRLGRCSASTSPTSPATTRPTAPSPASSSSCSGCGSPTSRCCSAPSSTPSSSAAASCRPASPPRTTIQLPPRDTRNIEKAEREGAPRTSRAAGRSGRRAAPAPRHLAAERAGQRAVTPSMLSRSRSAWPLCRAYSPHRCT